MSDRSIQQVIAFNQELIALAAAGLPLDLGSGAPDIDNSVQRVRHHDRSVESISSMLDQVNTALAMRVGRGQSIEQAVIDEPQLAPNYRTALLAFIRCDDPRVALEAVSAPATTSRRFARGIGSAMVYPLIVLVIAYFGFIYLSRVTGPAIESLYLQVNESPPAAVSFLANSHNWLPIWSIAIPLLLAFAVMWWTWRGSQLAWSWLPGSGRYYQSVRHAHVANQLSRMLESGCTLEDSLETMFPESDRATSDEPQVTKHFANETSPSNSTTTIDQSAIGKLPPLLRWAIEGYTGDEPLPKVLRFVAMTYQQTAERQERLWRVTTPAVYGLLVGGLFVLGYGLSLFLPVVQLLKDIAAPGSGFGGV